MTIQTYSLPELVDLALKTPIIGVVNFGILRAILHILITELGLQSFRTKLNITDMKPQKIHMPATPRHPSDIAESVEREFLSEMEEIEGEVPETENISTYSVNENISERTNPIKEEDEEQVEEQSIDEESKITDEHLDESSISSKILETRSIASDSFKGPDIFQEDMAEFWKSTTINSRITALENGLEKIVDIIDEQARDLEHFRRDTERRRAKDNSKTKDLQINLEELCQTANELIIKIQSCITKEGFLMTLEEHGKYVLEINNQLQDVDERVLELSSKLKGDYVMHEVLDDISDIKGILKIPTKKQMTSQFGTENIQYGEYPPDMQQLLGAATEFEKMQIKIAAIEEQLELIADSNKEMIRIRAEEAIANEEKMIEREAVIENLSLIIEQSKEKMKDFHESLKVQSNKLHNLTENVSEIAKIQDELMKEGKKNLQIVEEQLREIFKELRKFSILEDMQFHLEEVRNYKADRSEMLEGFKEKADKHDLDQKLDKTTYIVSCEKMNSSFNDIIAKIANQEAALERAVQDLTMNLNQKLERKEMDNHKEYLKEQLKTVAIKLKKLKNIVEEGPTAGGIKIRCLSCNRSLKQNERNVVISDGSRNAVLSRRLEDQSFNHLKLLPPLNGDKSNRSVGGFHTLNAASSHLRKASTAVSQSIKIWEEIPVQGSDKRIYRGYLEKPECVPVL